MARPDYAVFLGLDVGKEEHHACVLDPDGERLHDKPLPQDEVKLRELVAKLTQRGRVLEVVDQPASIGPLPVAVPPEPWPWPWPSPWPTFPVSRCAASPTCTRAMRRPTC